MAWGQSELLAFFLPNSVLGELSTGDDRKVLPVERLGSLNVIYSPCFMSSYWYQHVCLQGRIQVLGKTFKCVIAIHFTHPALHI